MTDCYIEDFEYVKSTPREGENLMLKEQKSSLMPKDIKFIIRLFAMKYNINITFIELENQGILDFSNTVSMPKYHFFLFHFLLARLDVGNIGSAPAATGVFFEFYYFLL